MDAHFFLGLLFLLFNLKACFSTSSCDSYIPSLGLPSGNGFRDQTLGQLRSGHVFSNRSRIRFNTPDLVLNDAHVITNQPSVRNYTLVITNQTASPDGFLRTMLVVNGQYPGPLIEANEGDTLNVLVINRMERPLSMHWHGLHQIGTPWMDGVSGVTQCPIQPGSSFMYTFQIEGQFGTFWYHAHIHNLKADGIVGPLIVHSTRDPLIRGRDYVDDRIVFVSDWYHNSSTSIISQMLSPTGYNGSFAAPSPNSVLLNGVGFFDCKRFAPGQRCKTVKKPLELHVRPNTKTRIRLIQSGSRALFRISVDRHPLEVIEADATPVRSNERVQRLQVHAGERYSVILDTSGDKEGDSFFFRAAVATDCLAWLSPEMATTQGNTAKAVIRVTNQAPAGNFRPSVPLPRDSDWPISSVGTCYDTNGPRLLPRLKRPAMQAEEVKGRVFFNTSARSIILSAQPTASVQNVLGRFFVDNTTYLARPQAPLLQRVLQGGGGLLNSSEVASETIDKFGFWDIVVNNLDANNVHPFHLHGMDSCLVQNGTGVLNQEIANTLTYNTEDCLCRDVHIMLPGSYNVYRVHAKNPGVWFFHCHMGWHLSAGFAGVIVMHPEILRNVELPPKNQALCQLPAV